MWQNVNNVNMRDGRYMYISGMGLAQICNTSVSEKRQYINVNTHDMQVVKEQILYSLLIMVSQSYFNASIEIKVNVVRSMTKTCSYSWQSHGI